MITISPLHTTGLLTLDLGFCSKRQVLRADSAVLDCPLHHAAGGGSGVSAFKHLSHEFLLVAVPADGYHCSGTAECIVDPRFREQFDIPQVGVLTFLGTGERTSGKMGVRCRERCVLAADAINDLSSCVQSAAALSEIHRLSPASLLCQQTVAWYDELLLSVPETYVGSPNRLRALVRLLSSEVCFPIE